MASSQSTGGKYNNITFFKRENFDLLAKDMLMKQGRVDKAKQTLEELELQMGLQLRAAKDEDNEYIQNRIMQANNYINEALRGGLDLSSSDNLLAIKRQFEQVVDENVFNSVSALRMRNAELEAQQKRFEKNPDAYNDANFAFYNQGWEEYLKNPKIGAKYNGSRYIDYFDMDKALTDPKFYDFLSKSGINTKFIQTVKQDGLFAAIETMEGTYDSNRLMTAVQSWLGAKGVQQMNIDAWALYGDGSNERQVELARKVYNGDFEKEKLETAKANAQKLLNGGGLSAQETTYYNQIIKEADKKIANLPDRDFDAVMFNEDGTINKAEYTSKMYAQHRNSEFYRLFNMAYMPPILKDRKIDEVSYKTALFNQKEEHFQKNLALKMNQHKATMKSKGFDEDGNPLNFDKAPHETTAKPMTQDLDDVLTFENQQYKEKSDNLSKAFEGTGLEGDGLTAVISDMLITNPTALNSNNPIKVTLGNGQEVSITLTDDQRTAIREFEAVSNGNTGIRAELANRYEGLVLDMQQYVINDYKKGGNVRDNIMGFGNSMDNYVFVKKGDRVVFEKGQINSKWKSNYNYLLDKAAKNGINSMSAEEKATLEYYSTQIALNDKSGTFSDNDKEIIKNNFTQKIVGSNTPEIITLDGRKVSGKSGYGFGYSAANGVGSISLDIKLSELPSILRGKDEFGIDIIPDEDKEVRSNKGSKYFNSYLSGKKNEVRSVRDQLHKNWSEQRSQKGWFIEKDSSTYIGLANVFPISFGKEVIGVDLIPTDDGESFMVQYRAEGTTNVKTKEGSTSVKTAQMGYVIDPVTKEPAVISREELNKLSPNFEFTPNTRALYDSRQYNPNIFRLGKIQDPSSLSEYIEKTSNAYMSKLNLSDENKKILKERTDNLVKEMLDADFYGAPIGGGESNYGILAKLPNGMVYQMYDYGTPTIYEGTSLNDVIKNVVDKPSVSDSFKRELVKEWFKSLFSN